MARGCWTKGDGSILCCCIYTRLTLAFPIKPNRVMPVWASNDEDDVILPASEPGSYARFADIVKNGKLLVMNDEVDVAEAEFIDIETLPDVGLRRMFSWIS